MLLALPPDNAQQLRQRLHSGGKAALTELGIAVLPVDACLSVLRGLH